jgi:hypothetical protein
MINRSTTMNRPRLSFIKMAQPYLNRAAITAKRDVIEQMADDCRVIEANKGCVTHDDMELLGWTPAQIEAHAKAAAQFARAGSVR